MKAEEKLRKKQVDILNWELKVADFEDTFTKALIEWGKIYYRFGLYKPLKAYIHKEENEVE